jgi:hypothetical protein
MIADDNSAVSKFVYVKSRDVVRGAMIGREPEHLIEIAVIQPPIPGYGEGCFAHHVF